MGKTAGFIMFIPLDFRRCEFMINEFYIMPEYRQYGLFKSEMFNLIINPNFNFYFRKPSIATVESLIDSGFAFKLNEKIAWSYFPFAVETGDMYTSKKIRRHIKKLNINSDHYACFSPYYDLDMGGALSLKMMWCMSHLKMICFWFQNQDLPTSTRKNWIKSDQNT